MKVNDSNLNAVTTTAHTQRADAKQSSRGNSGKNTSGSGDQVQLSSLSSLAAAASSSPDHAARVSRLAAAYQSGNYHADAHTVSKSVVSDAIRA